MDERRKQKADPRSEEEDSPASDATPAPAQDGRPPRKMSKPDALRHYERLAALHKQLADLELALVHERRERENDSDRLGEMLVRVAKRESELAAQEQRAIEAEAKVGDMRTSRVCGNRSHAYSLHVSYRPVNGFARKKIWNNVSPWGRVGSGEWESAIITS